MVICKTKMLLVKKQTKKITTMIITTDIETY